MSAPSSFNTAMGTSSTDEAPVDAIAVEDAV